MKLHCQGCDKKFEIPKEVEEYLETGSEKITGGGYADRIVSKTAECPSCGGLTNIQYEFLPKSN